MEHGHLSVSHLQFDNDTLILCANFHRQIRLLHCILRCFEGVTGLKVNFGKTAFMVVVDVPHLDMLVVDLGYKIGSLLATYLGLPLGASYKKMNV